MSDAAAIDAGSPTGRDAAENAPESANMPPRTPAGPKTPPVHVTFAADESMEDPMPAREEGAGEQEVDVAVFAKSIDELPYLIRVYDSQSRGARFACFFEISTGSVTTKRLSRAWRSPPCEPDGIEAFIFANIDSVLTKWRGPECTPAHPPQRAPPARPEDDDDDEDDKEEEDSALIHELNRLRTELEVLRETSARDIDDAFNRGSAQGRVQGILELQAEMDAMQRSFEAEKASLHKQLERALEDAASRADVQRDLESAEAKGYARGKQESEQSVRLLRDVAAQGAKRAREDGEAHARAEMAGLLEDAKRARDEAFIQGKEAAVREAENTMRLMRVDLDEALTIAEEAKRTLDQKREHAERLLKQCEGIAAELGTLRANASSENARLQGIVDELTAYVAELLAQQSKQ